MVKKSFLVLLFIGNLQASESGKKEAIKPELSFEQKKVLQTAIDNHATVTMNKVCEGLLEKDEFFKQYYSQIIVNNVENIADDVGQNYPDLNSRDPKIRKIAHLERGKQSLKKADSAIFLELLGFCVRKNKVEEEKRKVERSIQQQKFQEQDKSSCNIS